MFLLFLAFVVLLSGFVAYAADNIARRVGRSHLRLFGLRPKTTALIVAVASGMGISFASVLAFGLLNGQALRNIAQADVLRDELRELRGTVTQTRAELDGVREQAADLTRARDAAIRARDQAAQQAAASARERDDAYLQADAAAARTRALQERVQELDARRAELARKAEQAETALSASQKELSASQKELETLGGQLRTLETARATLEARVREAQAREAAAQSETRAAQQEAQGAQQKAALFGAQLAELQARARQLSLQGQALAAERDRLRAERDKAQQDVRAEQARRDAIVRDNANLQRSLQSAQADRTRLATDVARATSELSATRTGDLVFEKGDLVHTQVVASVYNLPEALSGAQAKAAARGASGRPAATLSPAAMTRLQTKVRAMNYSAVVVFRSATNAVQGFPVELTAEAFPNRPLYRRDEVIRSGSLRLGSQDAMRGQLLELVTNTLLDLQERGVSPENILNGGLSPLETASFLGGLKGSGNLRVGVASRAEVRPGNDVDLYPVLLK